jgi:hypothetical protein
VDGVARFDLGRRDSQALQPIWEDRPEIVAERLERDAVLWPARPGHRRLDRGQVEGQQLVERRAVARLAPQPLLLGVALDEVDTLRGPPGQAQVRQRLVVDGEERRRGAEFRAHVRDRGPVGERQAGEAVPGELDERPDHPVPPQQLGHDEHQIGGGRALGEGTGEADADDVGHRLVEGLAEQHRLGLDAADAVPQHAEGVDHRGV